MLEILTAGEILVEFMREKPGIKLNEQNNFVGPFVSGAPAIFADTVARMGHSSAIIGGVGRDDFGILCLERLKVDDVDISGVKISSRTTGAAFVAYKNDGSRNFIFHLTGSAATDFGTLPIEIISKVKIFHIMGCSLMISKDVADLIIEIAKIVKDAGGKISFDPNIRIELFGKTYIKKTIEYLFGITDIILPGIEELLLVTETKDIEIAIEKSLKKVDIVVLKKGRNGCEIYSKHSKEIMTVPAFEIIEIDPTGAGDSFDAGFLCGILEGKSLLESGILANACGALNASKFGPMEGVFKREIVDTFITDNE